MKRILLLFLFCAVLLCSCGVNADSSTDSPPDTLDTPLLPTDEGTTVSVDQLTLEFAKDIYDPSALLTLARETAPLLQLELALRGYEVSEISCTVGAANLMTAQALNEGGVDIALLPAISFAELCYDQALPILGATVKEDFPCGIYAANSTYGAKLSKKGTLSLEDLDGARWGIPTGDETLQSYVSLYLSDHYEGTLFSYLSSVTEFDSVESLASAAEKGEIDIAVLESSENLPLLFETEPIYTSVVAVSAQNEIVSSESFIRALQESFTAICTENPQLLALYDIRQFTPVQNADLDPARRILTIT